MEVPHPPALVIMVEVIMLLPLAKAAGSLLQVMEIGERIRIHVLAFLVRSSATSTHSLHFLHHELVKKSAHLPFQLKALKKR